MELSERMKKWHRRYVEDEDEKTYFYHSASYHTYFQGYSEQKVLRSDGKGYQIQRHYTAHYLTFTENKGRWIGFKLLYSALYLVSSALVLLALASHAKANSAGGVAVFGVLHLLMALLMLIPMGNYVAAPMYMRLGQYNISAKRLGQLAIPAVIFAALYLTTSLVWYAVKGAVPAEHDIRCLVLQVFSLAAISTLCFLEYKTKYRHIANKAAEERNSHTNEVW